MAMAMSQQQSRLLSLPGELRNRIYEYLFDDNRASNLNLLKTCRMARIEAGAIGFSSIDYRLDDSLTNETEICSRLSAMPLAFRNAITSVVCSDGPDPEKEGLDCRYTPDHERLPIICHTHGIFPVNVIHIVPCMEYAIDHIRAFRRSARAKSNAAYSRSIFGPWLDNPRLRSWRVHARDFGTSKVRVLEYDVVAVREEEEGAECKEASSTQLPCRTSDRIADDAEWLAGIKTVVLETYSNEFTVTVEQVAPDGEMISGLVRVHFSLHP